MDYAQALAYISATGRFGIKMGLERTRALLDALGRPDAGMRGVLVAGTNGKGSVCAYLVSALRDAGYRVGSMPKPHLQSYTERVCIDGVPITEADFAELITSIEPAVREVAREDNDPTEFEMLTAAAIKHLHDSAIDLLVCEVGMGGRLDSTNVLGPGVKVITTIGMDHERYLGSDIESIAREKAGIIHAGDAVITGELPATAASVVEERCAEVGATSLLRLGQDVHYDVRRVDWNGSDFDFESDSARLTGLHTPLRGRHQAHNAAVAIAILQVMNAAHGLHISDKAVRTGLAGASWPGRLELAGSSPEVLIDGAHNPAAISTVVETVQTLVRDDARPSRMVVLFGAMADKDWRAMLRLLPREWDAVYTAVDEERAEDPERLLTEARSIGRIADEAIPNSAVALQAARGRAGDGGMVVVLGSLYLAGEIRDAIGL